VKLRRHVIRTIASAFRGFEHERGGSVKMSISKSLTAVILASALIGASGLASAQSQMQKKSLPRPMTTTAPRRPPRLRLRPAPTDFISEDRSGGKPEYPRTPPKTPAFAGVFFDWCYLLFAGDGQQPRPANGFSRLSGYMRYRAICGMWQVIHTPLIFPPP